MESIPSELSNQLYPFQREGVEFVVKHQGRAMIGGESMMRMGHVPCHVSCVRCHAHDMS